MNIAIVGTSDWTPPGQPVYDLVMRAIEDAPDTVDFYARKLKKFGVDELALYYAAKLGYPVYALGPLDKSRPAVFTRDIALVEAADKVYVLFRPGLENTGGTQHVVEKALDAKKAVEVYTLDGENRLVLLGSHDGG